VLTGARCLQEATIILDYQGFFPLTNLDKPSWMELSFSRVTACSGEPG
jgi:hypothetical protein